MKDIWPQKDPAVSSADTSTNSNSNNNDFARAAMAIEAMAKNLTADSIGAAVAKHAPTADGIAASVVKAMGEAEEKRKKDAKWHESPIFQIAATATAVVVLNEAVGFAKRGLAN